MYVYVSAQLVAEIKLVTKQTNAMLQTAKNAQAKKDNNAATIALRKYKALKAQVSLA